MLNENGGSDMSNVPVHHGTSDQNDDDGIVTGNDMDAPGSSNGNHDEEQVDVPTNAGRASDSKALNTESLAATYGKRPSRLLLLSLLINIALLIYAHTGLSAVILSNIERVETNESGNDDTTNSNNNNTNTNTTAGACTMNERDLDRWYNNGGSIQKSSESSYCGTKYEGRGCLTDAACTTECFVNVWNYTTECAMCFGPIPRCSLLDGCAGVCQINNGVNEECQTCTKSCNDEFLSCSGLTFVDTNTTATNDMSDTDPTTTNNSKSNDNVTSFLGTTNEEICAAQQANVSYTEDIDELYIVYELKFFSAVQRAWTSNAKLLALIVVAFSGIWPYTKNFIMVYIWYFRIDATAASDGKHDPIQMYRRRHAMILWLKRLGKWSFVDVYIIVLLLIGLTLQISVNNGTVPLILKGEPRPAIIAFLFATVWSFIHLEVVNEYHIHQFHKHYSPGTETMKDNNTNTNGHEITPAVAATVSPQPATTVYDALRLYPGGEPLSWKYRLVLLALYVSTVVLLLLGSIYDVVHFTSYLLNTDTASDNDPGCIQAYNIYELGTRLVSNFFRYENSALPGVYVLFISYVLFVVVSHLLVHSIHIAMLLFHNIPQQTFICRLADICWTYASIEVLLLGIFAVQVRFLHLIFPSLCTELCS